jgi:hypothetical protein
MIKESDENMLSFVCSGCHLDSLPFPDGFYLEEEENITHQVNDSVTVPENFDSNLGIKNKKGLKFGHLNINGIRGKLTYLRLLFQETKFDFFCVNESKIDMSVSDFDISIPGYNIFRRDRNKNGGGVVVYVKVNLFVKRLRHLCSSENECVWLEIKLNKSSPFFLCAIYRPPSRTNEIEKVNNMCSFLTQCL